MTSPLKKEREELSTADIAQPAEQQRRDVEIQQGRPKLVQSERSSQADTSRPATVGQGVQHDSSATPLFPENELGDLRNNWNQIQAGFVDEPRKAVEQADGLVASTMKRLAESFARERANLEHQWDRGDNISTEDLRIALQRYRSFFHRLLAI